MESLAFFLQGEHRFGPSVPAAGGLHGRDEGAVGDHRPQGQQDRSHERKRRA